jgi:dinuclear metal center YbgI/SA1388 family protein
MARIADLVAVLETRYPVSWAEEWDSVGLVCGDPDAPVDRVLCAVDPVAETVDEAIECGAQVLFTHHPLFLGGTESVAATTAKGRLVHRLVTHGVALYVAHTNADVAWPGVSDSLASRFGLSHLHALQPGGPTGPEAPGGLGRVGDLPAPVRLDEFVREVAARLPATRWGVRAVAEPERRVARVAVCGGSGGDLAAAAAAAGADVLLTSDLKHHRTLEAYADEGIALIDAAHWATEQPWVVDAAALLVEDLGRQGTTVEATASAIVTDPWTLHAHSPEDS